MKPEAIVDAALGTLEELVVDTLKAFGNIATRAELAQAVHMNRQNPSPQDVKTHHDRSCLFGIVARRLEDKGRIIQYWEGGTRMVKLR